MALDQSWENTLLWTAAYPNTFRRDCSYAKWPDAPLPWARVDVWQHGGDANGATWPGIDGPADVDTFAGSVDQLVELVGSAR
jgi:GH25 family lysozyme M1 (1,4-beta-N-acetylmuramidase)